MSIIAPVRLTSGDGSKTATLTSQGSRQAVDVAPRAAGFSSLSVPPSLVSVGPASTLLLAANPARAYAHVVNNSPVKVFLQLGSAASLGRGIPLNPGALFQLEGGTLWLGTIYCISSGAAVNIEVMEAS